MLARLQPLDGAALPDERPRIVNFWATWCEPCRREMPDLQRLADLEPRFAVIGVTLDDDLNLAREFLHRHAIRIPQFHPAQDGASATPVQHLPETWVVAADGRLLARHAGARVWSDAVAIDELRRVTEDTPCCAIRE